MTALRNPKGTTIASRMEKIIYDFYSDLFDSHVHLPPHHLRERDMSFQRKGDSHEIVNYRPICLLPVIYKPFTRAILNGFEKLLDEGQPYESREHKMPSSTVSLTFIDLKKAFDSVETEAVMEALDNQGVPAQ
ncbi:hypothetical protein RB195_024338 [Necator americanus]|uniref:Reverse transcriptase domain-containing protein n=1 Tax=Necator americanus TaxID=51031 RepID=A0ABR1EQ08_NECAM